MKNIIFLFLLLLAALPSVAQSRTEKAILAVMDAQEKAWNTGNLEAFMEGYWKSDSLKFIGSKGLTYGWAQTLANYKKGYPTQAIMGTLQFTILSVEPLSRKSAFVIGKWHLTRQSGDVGGHFTLLWKKIKGQWVIVADHSS